jgi:hypothetical protein
MKICVTQREGTRYFSKFANISERDKLEVEVKFEDKNGKIVLFDLTSALIEEYANCPDIGRIDPEAAARLTAMTSKPVKIKGSMTVSPAYLTESKKAKNHVLAKVREAQKKAVKERKQKQAELDAARSERLVTARKVKAEKESARLTTIQAEAAKKIHDALKKSEAKAKAKQKPAQLEIFGKTAVKPAKAKTITTTMRAKPKRS